MKQNSFKATNWLGDSAPNLGNSPTSKQSLTQDNKTPIAFNPGEFFTPGWSGQSLISKNGIKVKKSYLNFGQTVFNNSKGSRRQTGLFKS